MVATMFDRKPIAFFWDLVLAVAFVPCGIWAGYRLWYHCHWLPESWWWLVPLAVLVVGEGLQALRLRRRWKGFVPLQKTVVHRQVRVVGEVALRIVFSDAFGSVLVVGAFLAYLSFACYLTYLLEVGAWTPPLWLQYAGVVYCVAVVGAMAIGFVVEFVRDPADFVGIRQKGG